MPRKGQRHAPDALGPGGSIARGTRHGLQRLRQADARVTELERVLWSASPTDLRALVETEAIPEGARPWAELAAAQMLRLRRAAEGEPGTSHYKPLSEPRIALLEAAQRLLLLGMVQTARSLQADDREAAATAGQLLGKFAALVKDAIGLDPQLDTTLSAHEYMEQKRTLERQPQGASQPSADRGVEGVGRQDFCDTGGGVGARASGSAAEGLTPGTPRQGRRNDEGALEDTGGYEVAPQPAVAPLTAPPGNAGPEPAAARALEPDEPASEGAFEEEPDADLEAGCGSRVKQRPG